MPEPVTIKQLLDEATQTLRLAGIDQAALDARLLLQHVAGLSHVTIISDGGRAVCDHDVRAFSGVIERRKQREPVHRIAGYRDFFGRRFKLSAETLEPRPETELLVEAALAIGKGRSDCFFADIGTGSGAIAISIVMEQKVARGIASDISPGALETAMANAEAQGCLDRLEFVCSNYLDQLTGPFELVVSNPPYIRQEEFDRLQDEVRLHDPVAALVSGPNGLEAYKAIFQRADRVLKRGGDILFEIGAGQMPDVRDIGEKNGFHLAKVHSDMAGIERVLHFTAVASG